MKHHFCERLTKLALFTIFRDNDMVAARHNPDRLAEGPRSTT